MSTVTEAVKESLVGTSREPQLSAQIKANFERHSRKDERTGELYMTAEDFVDAIAPEGEDYVSLMFPYSTLTFGQERERERVVIAS